MATRDSSLNHHKFMQYSLPDLMSMANSRNTASQGQPAQFDMTDLGLGPGTIQNGQLYFPKGSVTDNGNHARYITDNGQGGTGVNDVQNSKGFLGDLVGFKGLEGKNFLKEIGNNPSRLLTGIDPWSTKIWNKALGTDNKALVDQWGGATQQRFKDAEAAGINTGAGKTTEGLAHAVAAFYAGGALGKAAGLTGGTAGATTGSGTNGAFTALTPEAVYAGGLPAANAAMAGITPEIIAGAGSGLSAGGGLLAGEGGTSIPHAESLGNGNAFSAQTAESFPKAQGINPMSTAVQSPAVAGNGTSLLTMKNAQTALKGASALQGTGLLGGSGANGAGSGPGSSSQTRSMDPYVANYVYGHDGKGGLLADAFKNYQDNKSGMNPMMEQGLQNQWNSISDPRVRAGYNQMQQLGSGLMGVPMAGNPFTSGMRGIQPMNQPQLQFAPIGGFPNMSNTKSGG